MTSWLLSAAVAPARAGADTIEGGCLVVAADLTSLTNFITEGFLLDASVTRDAGGAPIGATVTCWLQVNGFEVPDTRFTAGGIGVQAGVQSVAFALRDSDTVLVCEQVVYGDGTGMQTCEPAPTEQSVPPPQVSDAVRGAIESSIDPIACPALVTHSGTYPGGLAIAADGDVSYTDPAGLVQLDVHDCPPYRSDAPPVLVVIGPIRAP